MAKIESLSDITGLPTVASNNDRIEAAFDNTLSRDGTAPNDMEANLDMNGFRILNVPDAVQNQEPVTLAQAATIAGVTNPLTRETVAAVLYPRTAAETTAGVTPTYYYYEPGDVRRYGATGDGATDDTDAFKKASDYINANDGGKLVIPSGVYIVGGQTFANGTGKGYSYTPDPIIDISSCSRSVIIEGNGAVLKMTNGLKIGSFDPTTGNVYNPGSLPFTNADYRADPGYIIKLTDNANVTVRNLELDGNNSNLTLGGYWGDTGRQCSAYGLFVSGNNNVLIENVYTHHHGLDGIIIRYPYLTETNGAIFPHTIINMRSEYNFRQGLSWTGGNSLTVINSQFNYTGLDVETAPAAGVDIEAEDSVCRNGVFIDCTVRGNKGCGIVADSGDSADISFIRCKFLGTYNWALWPNKPRMSFTDCLIVGSWVDSYYSATVPSDATRFHNCVFTDETKYSATLYLPDNLLSQTDEQRNVIYDTCHFICTRTKAGRYDNSYLRNCTFTISAGTSYCPNQDWFMILWGATIQNMIIKDNISTGVPADAFYVGMNLSETFIGRSVINSTNNKLLWGSWSLGGGGFAGYRSEQKPEQVSIQYLSVNKDLRHDNYGGTVRIFANTAEPNSGTWLKGDIVLNQSPDSTEYAGWVCVTAGTPGTWKGFGTIAS